KAYKQNTMSAYSALASATTLPADITSPSDTTPPSVPAGLTASPVSCQEISLVWAPSSDFGSGVKGYNVYRNGALLRQVSAVSTSTADTGLNASTSYSYAVSAVDNAGNESAKSSPSTATTPACPDSIPPSIPTALIASAVYCQDI